MFSKKKNEKNAKKRKTLKEIFLTADNLLRDIIIIIFTVILAWLLIINHRQILSQRKQPEIPLENTQQLIDETVPESQEEASENALLTKDVSSWKTFSNAWYGFELKYPEDWGVSQAPKPAADSNWEARYQFRKKEISDNDLYVGFDVAVYDVKKVEELYNTDEFPALKDENGSKGPLCNDSEDILKENENFPAEEINISSSDLCYNPAFFYTLTRDSYIYNIVPVLKDGQEMPSGLKKEAIDNFSEFFSSVANFNLIDIKRAKPMPRIPRVYAPMPIAHLKKVDGKLMCGLKNDHPAKSHKGKGRHLDMECCLDPDEYPNPNCYYPKSKYGKYL